MEAVLDTNVWLAWLVFDDPATRPIADALDHGGLVLPVQPRIRDELERVLAYPKLRLDPQACEVALRRFDRVASMQAPAPTAPLTCRDRDDQMFVDLALHRGADWLVTRDRQLLALRRRALASGLRIATPDDPAWRRMLVVGGDPERALL